MEESPCSYNEVLEEVIKENDENTSAEQDDEDTLAGIEPIQHPNLENNATKRKAVKQDVKQMDGKKRKKQNAKEMTLFTSISQPKTLRNTYSIASTTSKGTGSVGLIPILSRIEKKIDWLTFLMTGTAGQDDVQQQSHLQSDLEQTCSTSMNMPMENKTTSMENKNTSMENKNTLVNFQNESCASFTTRQLKEESQTPTTNQPVNVADDIVEMFNHSRSYTNFAVSLVRQMFERSELIGRNVCGVRGKLQMDSIRIDRIKDLVNQFYPSPSGEREIIWRNCRKAIDSFLRKLK